MEDNTKIGMNRTGMQMSPVEGPSQAQFALSQPPSSEGGASALAEVRAQYVAQSLRVGSVPLPGTGKGVLATTVDKIKGKNPEVLIDKLGQRLAFERSGVRLYQALITKVEASGHIRRAELRTDLLHICSEEAAHFHLLTGVMENLGADPTAQTPCADVSAVASLGLLQVITDPRTTIAQSLEAILTAELTDNACWELLCDLAAESGHGDLVQLFQQAVQSEAEHLVMVKKWLREMVLSEAA